MLTDALRWQAKQTLLALLVGDLWTVRRRTHLLRALLRLTISTRLRSE